MSMCKVKVEARSQKATWYELEGQGKNLKVNVHFQNMFSSKPYGMHFASMKMNVVKTGHCEM